MYNPHTDCEAGEFVGYRKPTPSECRFGEGATHYKTFDNELWTNPDGSRKWWIKCPNDGLRYYRSRH